MNRDKNENNKNELGGRVSIRCDAPFDDHKGYTNLKKINHMFQFGRRHFCIIRMHAIKSLWNNSY